MNRAVSYLSTGRRGGRLGQAVVPDILRDEGGSTDIAPVEPTAPAAPEPGFLGLPALFWVAVLGGLVLVTSGRRGR